MAKQKRYKPPRNSAERIAEARGAIRRLEDTLKVGENRYGDYGRRVRESIAGWQAVIERETVK